MGALNIPSAADIERLTRRLRAVSHRLEGIEDGVDRLDRALEPSGVEARLSAIEIQLASLTQKLDDALRRPPAAQAPPKRSGTAGAIAPRAKQVRAAKAAKRSTVGKPAKAGRSAKAARATKTAQSPGARGRAARGAPGKV
jgi:hypothetical protein